MRITARVGAKGRITIPKAVRDALDLTDGGDVVFRVEGTRVALTRPSDFLSLAGTVAVPDHRRNVTWGDVLRATRSTRSVVRR